VNCPTCNVPYVTYRAMAGESWQDCPFTYCPGHGRPEEPCYGEMQCYDDMDYGDGDIVCMEACDGHYFQAFHDMCISGPVNTRPRPAYEPQTRSL